MKFDATKIDISGATFAAIPLFSEFRLLDRMEQALNMEYMGFDKLSMDEFLEAAKNVSTNEDDVEEVLRLAKSLKTKIDDACQRMADINGIQERAKEDYDKRSLLGKLLWRGYSDYHEHYNAKKDAASLYSIIKKMNR